MNYDEYGNNQVFEKKYSISGSILSKKTGTYLSSKCVCANERSGKILVRLKKCKHFLVWLYLHSTKKNHCRCKLPSSRVCSKFIFWNNIWPLMSFILWARSCTINKWIVNVKLQLKVNCIYLGKNLELLLFTINFWPNTYYVEKKNCGNTFFY